MIVVRAVQNQIRLGKPLWKAVEGKFSKYFSDRLTTFRRWQDRQAHLYGRLLLWNTLRERFDRNDKPTILLDEFKRPYIEGSPIDFNISHTEGLVVCAVSEQRIGVDVERIVPVQLSEFKRVFTAEEYDWLCERGTMEEFFRLWTRKEAVMKADGRGFYLDAAGIDVLVDRIGIGNELYHVEPIQLADRYACHIASPEELQWEIREISVEELIGQLL